MAGRRSNEFDMTMAEFKGSVLAQLQQIQGDVTDVKISFSNYCEKTNSRILLLEMWKTAVVAKVAVVTAVFTIGVNMAWDTIKGRLGLNPKN